MATNRQHFISEKLSTMEERCRKNGLSLTVQRRAVLENLASRTDHPTADQIYGAIKGRVSGLSRTTVYRVLETFVKLGLAQKISNPEAKARFDADTRRHHHAVCFECEDVIDVIAENCDSLDLGECDLRGFEVVDYSMVFVGRCKACLGA
jgi:Fur family peroxide stress response transcriptional regulator